MTDKKEDKQLWGLSVLIGANGANVNGVLAQELHNPEIKCLKIKKAIIITGLKIIFEQI